MAPSLRYGFIGGGFITAFHLKAIEQIRGIEVAGLTSRNPPEKLAAYARERGLGEAKVYADVREMVPHVDVIAISDRTSRALKRLKRSSMRSKRARS